MNPSIEAVTVCTGVSPLQKGRVGAKSAYAKSASVPSQHRRHVSIGAKSALGLVAHHHLADMHLRATSTDKRVGDKSAYDKSASVPSQQEDSMYMTVSIVCYGADAIAAMDNAADITTAAAYTAAVNTIHAVATSGSIRNVSRKWCDLVRADSQMVSKLNSLEGCRSSIDLQTFQRITI
jgi:hypothetical protein